ncbi:MAG: hypothetical protein PWQ91_1173 [Eubacteriales bacterium]|nr:hypothetical protein [Eubacteriales bacterium]MDN5364112.1 hypothetical protein [Eubacteriales bacterium]
MRPQVKCWVAKSPFKVFLVCFVFALVALAGLSGCSSGGSSDEKKQFAAAREALKKEIKEAVARADEIRIYSGTIRSERLEYLLSKSYKEGEKGYNALKEALLTASEKGEVALSIPDKKIELREKGKVILWLWYCTDDRRIEKEIAGEEKNGILFLSPGVGSYLR